MSNKITQVLFIILQFFAYITLLQYMNFNKVFTINLINIGIVSLFSQNYYINYNKRYNMFDYMFLFFICRPLSNILYNNRFT